MCVVVIMLLFLSYDISTSVLSWFSRTRFFLLVMSLFFFLSGLPWCSLTCVFLLDTTCLFLLCSTWSVSMFKLFFFYHLVFFCFFFARDTFFLSSSYGVCMLYVEIFWVWHKCNVCFLLTTSISVLCVVCVCVFVCYFGLVRFGAVCPLLLF